MAGTDGFGIGIEGSVTGAIASIVTLEVPGISRDEINVTTHSSSNGWVEKLPQGVQGIPDITMSLLFLKAAETAWRTAAVNKTPETWTITDPDGNRWAANGFVKELGHDAVPVDDVIRTTVTLGFTGVATFTPVA